MKQQSTKGVSVIKSKLLKVSPGVKYWQAMSELDAFPVENYTSFVFFIHTG